MHKFMTAAAAGVALIGLSACDVDQTQEGELPEVSVEGGQMPEFDVDVADVEVRTEEATVEVPVIDIEEPNAGDGN